MTERSHIPVRYVDRVLKLQRRLYVVASAIDDAGWDPELAAILWRLTEDLSNASMAMNRRGPERDAYMAQLKK